MSLEIGDGEVWDSVGRYFFFNAEEGAHASVLPSPLAGEPVTLDESRVLANIMYCVLIMENGHVVTGMCDATNWPDSRRTTELMACAAEQNAFDKARELLRYRRLCYRKKRFPS